MKQIFTLLIMMIFVQSGLTQDIITKTNGAKIPCTITKEDSLNYYIITTLKDREINTFVPKSKVSEVQYASLQTQKLIKSREIIATDENGFLSSGSIDLTTKDLKRLLATHPPAMEKYSQGQTTEVLSYGFGFVGGYLIGYELGGQLNTGNFNGRRFAIGAGLSIISIIMSANGRKAKKKAIEIYNYAQNKNKDLSYGEKPNISLSSNGLLVHF
jgi:hypothetical protein